MKTADISELIELAGLGQASWDAVAASIVDAIPGSFAGMNGQNRKTGASSFVSTAGISEQSRQDYFTYYSKINPWNPYWQTWPSGEVMRTIAHCPAEQFSKTEFINDWLLPLQKNSIGFGIKLDSTAQDILNLIVHIPGNLPDRVEQAGILLLRQQAGNLGSAVRMNRYLADHVGTSVAAAALVARGDSIGFAVDSAFRIAEANRPAEAAFVSSRILTARAGFARFVNDAAQQWFTMTVASLLSGDTVERTVHVFQDKSNIWKITLARVPEYDPRGGNRFLFPRHFVLVLVENLRRPAEATDVAAMLRLFGLTPSEIRLCQALGRGLSLSEAADSIAITRETARQRLKVIFAKTAINRQADLIVLMARVGR